MGLERVPHVYCVVVVAGEENPSGRAKVDRVRPKEDRLLVVLGNLAVGAKVKETATEEREKQVNSGESG